MGSEVCLFVFDLELCSNIPPVTFDGLPGKYRSQVPRAALVTGTGAEQATSMAQNGAKSIVRD